MNRVFRVRWNRTLGLWQCVSEKTASMGKSASPLHAPATVNQPSAGWSSFLQPLFSHVLPPVLRPVVRPVVVAVMGALLGGTSTAALADPTWEIANTTFTVTIPQGETYVHQQGYLYTKFPANLLQLMRTVPRGTLKKAGEGTLLLDGPLHQTFWPTVEVTEGTLQLGLYGNAVGPSPIVNSSGRTPPGNLMQSSTIMNPTLIKVDNDATLQLSRQVARYLKTTVESAGTVLIQDASSLMINGQRVSVTPSSITSRTNYKMAEGSRFQVNLGLMTVDGNGEGRLTGTTALVLGAFPEAARLGVSSSEGGLFITGDLNRRYSMLTLKNYSGSNPDERLTLSQVSLGDGLTDGAIASLGAYAVPHLVIENSDLTLTGDLVAAKRASGAVEWKGNNTLHITESTESHGVHHLFDNLRSGSNDAQVSMDGGTLTLDVQGSSQAEIARNVMMAGSGTIVKTGTGHLTVHDVDNPNVTWVYKEGGFRINADASLQGESNARPYAGAVSHVHMQGRKTDETTDAYSTNLELAGSVSFDHDVFESLDNGQGQITVLSGTTNVRTTQSYQGRTDIRGGSLRLSTSTDGTNFSRYLGTSRTAVDTGDGERRGTLSFIVSNEWNNGNIVSATSATWNRGITGTGDVVKYGDGQLILKVADTDLVDGHGYFDYSGDTIIDEGEVLLETNMHITQTRNLKLGGYFYLTMPSYDDSPRWWSRFVLRGTATVRSEVQLGSVMPEEPDPNNQIYDPRGALLEIQGATLKAGDVVRTEGSLPRVAPIVLRFTDGGTLNVTSAQKQLFYNFDTTPPQPGEEQPIGRHGAPRPDSVELGVGGGTIAVDRDLTSVQYKKAAISDAHYFPYEVSNNADDLTTHTLVKAGEGTLVLTAKNSYSGSLVVANGRLQLGDGTDASTLETTTLGGRGTIYLGSQAVADSGHAYDHVSAEAQVANTKGQLAIAYGQNVTYTLGHEVGQGGYRQVTGHGDVVQVGPNRTVVSDAHTYDGDTMIRGGTLELADGGQLGTSVNAIDTGDATDHGTFEINTTDPNKAWTRLIAGTGNFTKTGTGTVTLDHGVSEAANVFSYEGDTRVENGELILADDNSISQTANLVVSASAENRATSATFTLVGDARVRDTVTLVDAKTADGSMNQLTLDGATLEAGKVVSQRDSTNATAKIALELKNRATLRVTGGEEASTILFAGFDTTDTHGDKVQLGTNGARLGVAEGKTARQEKLAVISDAATPAVLDRRSAAQNDADTHHLVKIDAGTLVLTAKNTYSGKLVIANGRLQLGDGTDESTPETTTLGGRGDIYLGSSIVTGAEDAYESLSQAEQDAHTKGQLAIAYGEGVTYTLGHEEDLNGYRKVTGHGDLIQLGPNTTEVSDVHDYDGDTIIRGGTLVLNDGGQLGRGATAIDTGDSTGHGTFEINTAEADKDWTRLITGTGNFTKTGDGKVTLKGSDLGHTYDYTGDTRVEAGELVLDTDNEISRTKNLVVSAKAEDGEATFTLKGTARVRDAVVLVDEATGDRSTNRLTLDAATLEAKNIISKRSDTTNPNAKIALLMEHGAKVRLTNSGTLFDGFDTSTAVGDTIQIGEGGTTLDVDGVSTVVTQSTSAVISDDTTPANVSTSTHSLTKTGDGTLVITAKNTYTGLVKVTGGTLQLGNGGHVTDTELGGHGNIDLANGATFAVDFSNDAQDVYHLGGTGRDGQIRLLTGTGNVTVLNGHVVVDRAHTYAGDTIIRGGDLTQIWDNDVKGYLGATSNSGAISTGEGDAKGVFILDQSSSDEYTQSRLITGTGAFTKRGTGTTVLDHGGATADVNDYSFSGALRVEGGTLIVAEKNKLSHANSITVSAKDASTAKLTLSSDTEVSRTVPIVLGEAGVAAGTMSMLDLNGTHVNVNSFTTQRAASDQGRISLLVRNGAKIDITEADPTTHQVTVLSAFNSDRGDKVEVGTGGVTVDVADGITAIQAKRAVVSDYNDTASSEHTVTKVGGGTLILNEVNTYSGSLIVKEGKVLVGADGADARSVSVGGSGTIQLDRADTALVLNMKNGEQGAPETDRKGDGVTQNGDYVLSSRLTGVGSLTQQGTGKSILVADNTYTGKTTITQGTLQVGNYSEASLGGTGDIQNDGHLTFSVAQGDGSVGKDVTLDRKVTGTGVLEQKGEGTLFVNNVENDFTGNVLVTTGILQTQSLAALGKGATVVLGQEAANATPAAASEETVAPARRLMARRLASFAVVPEVTHDAGTLRLDLDHDEVMSHDLTGTGNLEKLGTGGLLFTTAHTYTQSGDTRLLGGSMVLEEGVDMPNTRLQVQKGIFMGDLDTHNFRQIEVSGTADESHVVLFAKNMTNYTKYWASDSVNVTGGSLFVDLSRYNADHAQSFSGNIIPNVFKAESGVLVGADNKAAHKFASYDDNSVLFNFAPYYDYETNAIHLVVTEDTPQTLACQNANMGKVECIVRKYGDLHAVPLAKVADKEFAENPLGTVAQYFYSIDTEERVDNAVIRGLPLFTGSVNQTLQHDAQAAAAYAPRDPCDPRATEHGYNLWAQLERNWDQQGALRGSPGYDGRHNTLAIGNDVCVKERDLRIGGLVAYTDSSLTSHGNQALHSAKTDLYQIGVYGDKQFSETTDLDFQAGYGRGRVEGHRNLLLFTADSKYDVNLFYLGAGYNWRKGWYSPFVRFDYNYVRANSYKETGATVFSYNVEHLDRHSGILQLGSRFDWQPNDRWHLKGKVALGYEMLDKYNTITAAFQGIPHAYFDTRSAEDHRVMGIFEAGVGYKASDRVDFSLNYRAIVKPDYHDQGGQVQMTLHF